MSEKLFGICENKCLKEIFPKEEMEEIINESNERLIRRIVLNVTGEEPLTSGVASKYKDVTTKGVYPDSTFKYVETHFVKSFSSMFNGCTGLTKVSDLDTHNGTGFGRMFENCSSLKNINELDTRNGTYFAYMFNGCSSLTEVPKLDTRNGTYFAYMFNGCSSLTEVPKLDTSKGGTSGDGMDFNSMFEGCSSLTSIPDLDTHNGMGFAYMFQGCTNLVSIPDLDISNMYDRGVDGNMFKRCTSLTTFRDSPYAPEGSRWQMNCGHIYLNDSPLDRESILKLFNGLIPASDTTKKYNIYISVTTNGYLSDEDKAIATNKGWKVYMEGSGTYPTR